MIARIAPGSQPAIGRRWRSSFVVVALATTLVGLVATAPSWAGRVSYTGPSDEGKKSADCDRCNVQALFASKMRDYQVSVEVLELRNGMAVLYSTDDRRLVPKVQQTAEWACDQLTRIARDPDKWNLCRYCKASQNVFSKVDREVVRTASGALFFMRSEDPEAVRALKAMVRRSQNEDGPPPISGAPSR
jgi:hypothetical protein